MKKHLVCILIFFTFIIALSLSLAYAQVPSTLNFSAKLTDKQGTPLNGNYQIEFKLYDSVTSTKSLWDETQTVLVEEGVANLVLGRLKPLNLDFDRPYWLELIIQGEKLPERLPLSASAYSLNSSRLGGYTPDQFLLKTASGDVGIGSLKNPQARLDVYQALANNFAAKITNYSTDGLGLSIAAGDYGEQILNLSMYNGTTRHSFWASGDAWLAQGGGKVGIGTVKPQAELHVKGSAIIEGNYLKIPVVSQDPANPQDGMFWYNSTEGAFKAVSKGQIKKFALQ